MAVGAATGSGEPPTVAEDKLAILAAGRLQDEAAGLVVRDGFHDVFQMILDLPLGNAEHLGQLVCRQTGAGQQFDDALAGSPCGREHGRIVIQRRRKAKPGASGAHCLAPRPIV